MFYLEEK